MYICLHGKPDDGFGEDQYCLEETLKRFPTLEQDHIVTALQHIHMRTDQLATRMMLEIVVEAR
jgi:hypothetical protein